jgi:hypothetical protein
MRHFTNDVFLVAQLHNVQPRTLAPKHCDQPALTAGVDRRRMAYLY